MVYLIGDSHVQSATGDDFIKIHLVAPTAYQNYKRITEIDKNLSNFKINKNGDYLFFSFGEIDIRCHLGFIADKTNRTYNDVVKECVNRYLSFLIYFIDKGYKIGVWGVIPSGPNNGIQGNGAASYKTKEERNELTRLFNLELKNVCEEKNIIFKSLFDNIITDMSNYDNYFSKDNIHLNAGMFKTHENNIDCEKLVIEHFKDII